MKIFIRALLLAAILVSGCDRPAEEPAAEAPVPATPAYQTYFGTPPTTSGGTCYALVGYLPVAGVADRVRPVPLFAFRRDGQPALVIVKLLEFDRAAAGRLGLEVPFPPGTRLEDLVTDADRMTVSLTMQDPEALDVPGALAALGQSLAQFPGGERVFLRVNGSPPAEETAAGIRPDPDAILPPEPPQLLGLSLDTESVGGHQQLAVLFDRPVDIERVNLFDGDVALAGDLFSGMFDMAAVLELPEAGTPAPGTLVTVDWAVVDHLGRRGQGRESLPVRAALHP